MIETKNLRLIPCGPAHLAMALEDEKRLEPLPGVPVVLSHPGVAAVKAETLPCGRDSIRALQKLGMGPAGARDGVLRWRLDRRDFTEGGAP